MQNRDRILNVFFDGTDGHIRSRNSLTNLLYDTVIADNKQSFKMGFNGCGIQGDYSTSCDFGGIFTYGLAEQVKTVVAKVRDLLSKNNDTNLIINTYGFSRGGAATFLLAKELLSLSSNMSQRIAINIATLEPVPGNLPTLSKIDITGHSLTSQIWDISNCQVRNMLVLYTNKMLHANDSLSSQVIADAHAPILPSYPVNCHAEIDVMQGCHKTAQMLTRSETAVKFRDANALLTFFRIKKFFEQQGSQFDFIKLAFQYDGQNYLDTDTNMVKLYELILNHGGSKITREMHKDNQIVTDYSQDIKYLNMHHKQLCCPNMNINQLDCTDVALRVAITEPERPKSECLLM